MPQFLIDRLKREYPGNNNAVYGTMNKIGAMHGNKETEKGRQMEMKHWAHSKGAKPMALGGEIDTGEPDPEELARLEEEAKLASAPRPWRPAQPADTQAFEAAQAPQAAQAPEPAASPTVVTTVPTPDQENQRDTAADAPQGPPPRTVPNMAPQAPTGPTGPQQQAYEEQETQPGGGSGSVTGQLAPRPTGPIPPTPTAKQRQLTGAEEAYSAANSKKIPLWRQLAAVAVGGAGHGLAGQMLTGQQGRDKAGRELANRKGAVESELAVQREADTSRWHQDRVQQTPEEKYASAIKVPGTKEAEARSYALGGKPGTTSGAAPRIIASAVLTPDTYEASKASGAEFPDIDGNPITRPLSANEVLQMIGLGGSPPKIAYAIRNQADRVVKVGGMVYAVTPQQVQQLPQGKGTELGAASTPRFTERQAAGVGTEGTPTPSVYETVSTPTTPGISGRAKPQTPAAPAGPIADKVKQAAIAAGVDPALAMSVAAAESAMDPKAVSPKGAIGVMQLMPNTATGLGVTDPFNPDQNIEGGVRYLGQLLKRYNGDTAKALAAYNAGPGVVDAGGPLPRETTAYVQKVMGSVGTPQAPAVGSPIVPTANRTTFTPANREAQLSNIRPLKEIAAQLFPDKGVGLIDFADLADDPGARARTGKFLGLIMSEMNNAESAGHAGVSLGPVNLSPGGVGDILSRWLHVPGGIQESKVQMMENALAAMPQRERDYVNMFLSSKSAITGMRKATGGLATNASISALDKDLPYLSMNVLNKRDYIQKMANMARIAATGLQGYSKELTDVGTPGTFQRIQGLHDQVMGRLGPTGPAPGGVTPQRRRAQDAKGNIVEWDGKAWVPAQ